RPAPSPARSGRAGAREAARATRRGADPTPGHGTRAPGTAGPPERRAWPCGGRHRSSSEYAARSLAPEPAPRSLSDDCAVVTILYDSDMGERLRPADAVRWMGEAVDAHHRGELVAPPRAHVDFTDARLVFPAGRLRGSWFGYRSYD